MFLRDLDSGLEIHQVTGNEGRFQFLAERGRYHVTAAMSGFDSATRDLNPDQSGPADLRLQLSPAALDTQVVVVSGSREQELIENSTTKVDVIPKWTARRRPDLGQGQHRGGMPLRHLLAQRPDHVAPLLRQVAAFGRKG